MTDAKGITQLSSLIHENTQKIERYLAENNLHIPSLDAAAPLYPIPDDAPAEIKQTQAALIEACGQLKDVMTGPRELIRFNWTAWVSVKAILRFNIDKSFAVGSQTTFEAISQFTGLNLRNVTRIVRHAIINHKFFAEPSPGVIVHSGLTAILNRDELARNALQFSLDEFWTAAVFTVDAMEKWPNSEEPNQTGFSLANGNKSIYEIFAEYPERGGKFGMLMSNMDEKREFLLEGFPWGEKRMMVDVGGSHGSIAISVAERFPHMKCIVQDLPEVIEEGKARLPAHLKDRVELMVHDFFKPQPIEADVYYFRSIFHNWSDKYSVQILRNLIPALKPGASIIIHERMLPSSLDKLTTLDAKRALNMDVGMLQLLNSHQRDADDWPNLFKEADARFQYVGAHKHDDAVRWIIEASWQG